MKVSRQITGIVVTVAFLFFSFGLPQNIQKKVDKEVAKLFAVTEFSMQAIEISNDLNAKLPSKISQNNLYKLFQRKELLGYAFVDQALSKTAKFDYLVIFDGELKVIHTKVLVYREEYGGEIGSKRWLRQFLGKTGKDRVDYKTNIDGISGATISVRAMTNSMDDLLQTVGILQENKVF